MQKNKENFFSKERCFSSKQAFVLLEALFCLGIFALSVTLFMWWISRPLEKISLVEFSPKDIQRTSTLLEAKNYLQIPMQLQKIQTPNGIFYLYAKE